MSQEDNEWEGRHIVNAYAMLTRRFERLEDECEQLQEGEVSTNALTDFEDGIRTFFVVANAMLEEVSAAKIQRFIISDDAETEDIGEYVFEKMSQAHRIDVLYRAEVIDGHLMNGLQEVSGARNDLAHTYMETSYDIDWEDEYRDKAELAIDVYQDLLDASLDGDGTGSDFAE